MFIFLHLHLGAKLGSQQNISMRYSAARHEGPLWFYKILSQFFCYCKMRNVFHQIQSVEMLTAYCLKNLYIKLISFIYVCLKKVVSDSKVGLGHGTNFSLMKVSYSCLCLTIHIWKNTGSILLAIIKWYTY